MQQKNGLFSLFLRFFVLNLCFLQLCTIAKAQSLDLHSNQVNPNAGFYYLCPGDSGIVFTASLSGPSAYLNPNGCLSTGSYFEFVGEALTLDGDTLTSSIVVGTTLSFYLDPNNYLPGHHTLALSGYWYDIDCQTWDPYDTFVTIDIGSPNILPTVSIWTSPQNYLCAGTTITMYAICSYMGYTPSFVWKKNGVVIVGADSLSYVTNTLVIGDIVTCEMTSSMTCLANTLAVSDSVTITAPVTPSVSINSNPSTAVCPNTNIVFTPTPNVGNVVTYSWYKNGAFRGSSSMSSPSFTFNTNYPPNNTTINNGDTITCVMTPYFGCFTAPQAVDTIIVTNMIPKVAIANSNASLNVCTGGTQQLIANTANGSTCSYMWQSRVNANPVGAWATIPGDTSATYTPPASPTSVFYRIIRDCGTCPTDTSQDKMIQNQILHLQVYSAGIPDSTKYCGSMANLSFNASYSTGNSYTAPMSYQWQQSSNGLTWNNIAGATSAIYNAPTVSTTTYYKALVSNNDTITHCSANPTHIVFIEPIPILTITANGSTSQGIGDTLLLTSSVSNASLAYYQWQKDNIAIPGATNDSLYITTSGDYRLFAGTLSGCGSSSNLISNVISAFFVGIEDNYLAQSLQVYPNPASQNLFITFEKESNTSTHILITNTLGQVVYQKSVIDFGNIEMAVDVSEFAAGVYRLILQGEERNISRNIVVVKP